VAQHLCREADAACAYDVVEQRFHGRDAVTNFRLLTSPTRPPPPPSSASSRRALRSRSSAGEARDDGAQRSRTRAVRSPRRGPALATTPLGDPHRRGVCRRPCSSSGGRNVKVKRV
jgi:hypothetical protein